MTEIRNRWRILVLESSRNDSDGVEIGKPQNACFAKDEWRLCRENLCVERRPVGAPSDTIAVEEEYLTLLAFGGHNSDLNRFGAFKTS
jgi:hypothetical protein